MKDIVWIGRFRGSGGFATAAREYVLATREAGIDLRIAPLMETLENDDPLHAFEAPLPLPDDTFRILNHQPIMDPDAQAFLSVWEYDRIPNEWVDSFDQAVVVMTQSTFCRDMFACQVSDPSKIHVVPYIVPAQYRPKGDVYHFAPPGTFVFGSVFEWVPRKVPELTIQAFTEEFGPEEPVRLVLRTSHPEGEDTRAIVRKLSDDPRIIVLPSALPELSGFYRGLDACTCCTAGEGFNQTLAEAMACGIPVIASRHSGNLDFMDDSNSYLADVEDWSPVPGTDVDGECLYWRKPVVASIRECMRKVYTEMTELGTASKRADPRSFRAKYSRAKIGATIAKLLRDYAT
jgi:glycosyltransferase involved in cell wall biosynthesis